VKLWNIKCCAYNLIDPTYSFKGNAFNIIIILTQTALKRQCNDHVFR